MKKTIIIIALCALQSACTHYVPAESAASPLLSFKELGAEITVTRIVLEEPVEIAAANAP